MFASKLQDNGNQDKDIIMMKDEFVGQIIGIAIALAYIVLVFKGAIPADAFGVLAGIAIRHFIGIDSNNKNGGNDAKV